MTLFKARSFESNLTAVEKMSIIEYGDGGKMFSNLLPKIIKFNGPSDKLLLENRFKND